MNIQQYLNQELSLAVDKIRQAMQTDGVNASGKSAKSIRPEVKIGVSQISIRIYAGPGVYYTDKGRGPSRSSSGAGGGFSKEDAKQWARDKGLSPWLKENGKQMSEDERAFLIQRKVHREGFYGNNSQGKDYINPVTDELTQTLKANLKTVIFDTVKQLLRYGNNTNTAA